MFSLLLGYLSYLEAWRPPAPRCAFAPGEPAFAVLAEVQTEDGVVVRVFGASREISLETRGLCGGGRCDIFVGPAELANDVI